MSQTTKSPLYSVFEFKLGSKPSTLHGPLRKASRSFLTGADYVNVYVFRCGKIMCMKDYALHVHRVSYLD